MVWFGNFVYTWELMGAGRFGESHEERRQTQRTQKTADETNFLDGILDWNKTKFQREKYFRILTFKMMTMEIIDSCVYFNPFYSLQKSMIRTL